MFADGKVFDESAQHGNVPLDFKVNAREMIRATTWPSRTWSQGGSAWWSFP
jgi:FKBP-type peptidyl-prolyl cis-trans isomerase